MRFFCQLLAIVSLHANASRAAELVFYDSDKHCTGVSLRTGIARFHPEWESPDRDLTYILTLTGNRVAFI